MPKHANQCSNTNTIDRVFFYSAVSIASTATSTAAVVAAAGAAAVAGAVAVVACERGRQLRQQLVRFIRQRRCPPSVHLREYRSTQRSQQDQFRKRPLLQNIRKCTTFRRLAKSSRPFRKAASTASESLSVADSAYSLRVFYNKYENRYLYRTL